MLHASVLRRPHCKDIVRSKNCIYISRSKNRSDRYAVLSDKAYALLVDYVRRCYKGARPEDWLFPGQDGSRCLSTESVRRILSKALRAAGLHGCGFSPRSLRHAFGLHLYEAGADLMSIKEAMGHKSLSSATACLTLGIGNGRTVRSPYDSDG